MEDHAVAVDQGRIIALLPVDDARQRFLAKRTEALPEHVLLPGLINLHTHAAMTLLRGYADDLPLMRWLQAWQVSCYFPTISQKGLTGPARCYWHR